MRCHCYNCFNYVFRKSKSKSTYLPTPTPNTWTILFLPNPFMKLDRGGLYIELTSIATMGSHLLVAMSCKALGPIFEGAGLWARRVVLGGTNSAN